MSTQRPRQHVLLIHGLAAHRLVMQRLWWELRSPRMSVENWGYPSIRKSIPELARLLRGRLDELETDADVDTIHLVTHSMGCIIGRCALLEHPSAKVRRWVMLAPPNRGSHTARTLAPWLGWFCKPLHELADTPHSFVNQLGVPENVEIGVIAASSDFVVAASSTHLPGQQDWCVLEGLHSGLLWRRETAEAVRRFLETGRF